MNKKMKLMRMVLSCLFLFLFVNGIKAQDTLLITLDQALEIALSESPTVKIANNQVEIKKYVKRETMAALLPNVSASGVYSQALELQKMKLEMMGQVMEMAMGQEYTLQGTFNLALPLIAPQLWKSIQINSKDIELSLEAARSSKIDLIKQVKNAYYSHLLAIDAYETLLLGYNNAEMNAQNVSDMYAQGLVSEYDKLVADVSLKNQWPNVVNAKNAVQLTSFQLKVLMGVDVNEHIRFEGSLRDFEYEMLADLEKLKRDTSLIANTNLRQIDIQAEQLKKAEQLNKFGYIPTLGLGVSYGWQSMENNLKFKDYSWFPGSTLNLQLSIPIFDGLAKHYKTKQNKISLLTLNDQRSEVKNQLNLGVVNSLNNIESAVERLASNKEVLVQAERAFNISQKKYSVGSGTVLEMNNSEMALTQSRLQYAQAIFDFLSAKAELESLLGKTIEITE
jgi:outer membrane protein TolC